MATQASVTVAPAAESSPRSRGVMQEITAESLLAELAAARQSGADQWVPSRPEEAETPRKSGSVFDQALVFGALAVGLFALLTMSPWRDRVPQIERITNLLN